MALRPDFSLGHSEFDEFLFASIGEEKNGSELTVLSALTRLGLDPWAEAARLSDLPEETAAHALAATIAGLPEGAWTALDSGAIAARLVKHLPKHGGSDVQSPWGRNSGHQKTKTATAMWLICIVLAAAGLFAMLDQYAGRNSVTDQSSVSSTRP